MIKLHGCYVAVQGLEHTLPGDAVRLAADLVHSFTTVWQCFRGGHALKQKKSEPSNSVIVTYSNKNVSKIKIIQKEQSDLDLYCFPRPDCLNMSFNHCGTVTDT